MLTKLKQFVRWIIVVVGLTVLACVLLAGQVVAFPLVVLLELGVIDSLPGVKKTEAPTHPPAPHVLGMVFYGPSLVVTGLVRMAVGRVLERFR